MGIPFLTRHLYPFAEAVILGKSQEVQHKQTEHVEAVVIDGPSLVYNVSMRLLSLSNTPSQPTCDEVSCAVMYYLLQLSMLGVKIHKIYFDGALPDDKRETRLARLERSRKKLVTLRTSSPQCFQNSRNSPRSRIISPKNILQRRSLPAKYANIPENPFIVPAVFEDLKHRWCKKNINSVVKDVPDLDTVSLSDFPWRDAVVMVPGEADTYCAHVARLTGCAILTNDSDLLLHDLGKHGSVVLLDSIEPWTCEISRHKHTLIRALRLCPNLVAYRLGLTSLLPLAYELKTHPDTGLKQILQQSKDRDESSEHIPGYCRFVEEYKSRPSFSQEMLCESYPQHLDPRISELFSLRGRIPESSEQLCMYLVVLNEDPARQCAWAQGKLYRSMAYTALNLSFSADESIAFVDEYVRRGSRITTDRIPMGNREWLLLEMSSLCSLLDTVHLQTRLEIASPAYWRVLAFYIIHYEQTGSAIHHTEHLRRLLTLGNGDNLDWANVHLMAQMQSVLYSLRILRQILGCTGFTDNLTLRTRTILDKLPPLSILMRSVHEMTQEFRTDCSVSDLVDRLIKLMGKSSDEEDSPDYMDESRSGRDDSATLPTKVNGSGDTRASRSTRTLANIYELLSEQ
ncbi:uncharacterized protein BO88DRAFT_111613 [Aspergillus vadensis CBS 113365]|uniref:Asteroid domain-containing protein n=1 Tax=Aspergillus vadensis (strain CBS 113365 / IMI 142717 / IBT 24658) TaxID=1448311 RepID=A0A319B1F6_ASPVC|nr:hypothetical protein BO88DRAFT_111613 [Aspergillus vadensis CBS 113365]PYH66506.1 hypothetical protein BO88DRAFT_111613 [Aspergillus vadensis CBS 113365]